MGTQNNMNDISKLDLASYDWDSKIKEDLTKNAKFSDPSLWNPDKKNPNTYTIRFIPDAWTKQNWAEISTHNIIHFPNGEKKFFFGNCLTTKIKGRDVCPICTLGWGLWKTKIKANQDKAKDGGWIPKQEWVSNILVVRDPIHPENNGKIFKYKYGITIYKMIANRVTPDEASKNDPDFKEFNPFHPVEGANFKLKVTMKDGARGVSYPNYEQSSFYDEQTQIAPTNKEINAILAGTYNLQDYINSLPYLSVDIINKEVGYLLSSSGVSVDSSNDDDTNTTAESPVVHQEQAEPQVGKPKGKVTVNKKSNSVDDLSDKEAEFIKNLT